ncbi:MAG: hypothetical protein GX802_01220, partial [Clostridiales bacterium]|nr:hypothetical protein [Clostridiales bacterium]
INQPGVFIDQAPGECTLASAVMMLRRRAIINGDANWASITTASVKPYAWSGGLLGRFPYNGMNVGSSKDFSGGKKARFIALLNEHPEGV